MAIILPFSLGSRAKRAWNAFFNKDPTNVPVDLGYGYGFRPDRMRYSRGNERSIITAIFNRIAIDSASIKIRHVRLDNNGRFLQEMDTGLNKCLSLSANIDQTGRAFIQDAVASLLDEGCIAIVPVDTDDDPEENNLFRIETMRVGKILEWYPAHVKILLYNDRTGKKEELIMHKSAVGIVESPLYAIINEPNSTMQRLIRKLNLLDIMDEKNSSGKLDLIIQLPYIVKTKTKQDQAEIRLKSIQDQLVNSRYGIAYTDATERITQLNRPVENNLMSQIEYLTSMLYSQLGITQGVLDGSADDKTMQNYYTRTIEPIIAAITDELKRKFLTQTARTQGQSVEFFRDPFKLVPVSDLAEIADKFTRNAILSSNEIRQIVGMKPSDDPDADKLRNKNLNESAEEAAEQQPPEEAEAEEEIA